MAMDIRRCDEVRLADCFRNGKEIHLKPGEGDFDFPALFRRLDELGFAGHYMNAFGTLEDMLEGREVLARIEPKKVRQGQRFVTPSALPGFAIIAPLATLSRRENHNGFITDGARRGDINDAADHATRFAEDAGGGRLIRGNAGEARPCRGHGGLSGAADHPGEPESARRLYRQSRARDRRRRWARCSAGR